MKEGYRSHSYLYQSKLFHDAHRIVIEWFLNELAISNFCDRHHFDFHFLVGRRNHRPVRHPPVCVPVDRCTEQIISPCPKSNLCGNWIWWSGKAARKFCASSLCGTFPVMPPGTVNTTNTSSAWSRSKVSQYLSFHDWSILRITSKFSSTLMSNSFNKQDCWGSNCNWWEIFTAFLW